MANVDPSLQAQFEAAVEQSKNLAERPDSATLLKLYALFKQGSEGDVTGEKPGAMDFVGAAKWSARDALRGTSMADAMKRYIALVEGLKG
jgi:acyl-CoA-binding protein